MNDNFGWIITALLVVVAGSGAGGIGILQISNPNRVAASQFLFTLFFISSFITFFMFINVLPQNFWVRTSLSFIISGTIGVLTVEGILFAKQTQPVISEIANSTQAAQNNQTPSNTVNSSITPSVLPSKSEVPNSTPITQPPQTPSNTANTPVLPSVTPSTMPPQGLGSVEKYNLEQLKLRFESVAPFIETTDTERIFQLKIINNTGIDLTRMHFRIMSITETGKGSEHISVSSGRVDNSMGGRSLANGKSEFIKLGSQLISDPRQVKIDLLFMNPPPEYLGLKFNVIVTGNDAANTLERFSFTKTYEMYIDDAKTLQIAQLD